MTKKMIYLQLGPPPPVTAPARLHLHYAFLHRVRSRSHVVDAVNAMVDGTAMLIVKLIFCWCLGRPNGLDSMSMRLMFTPFWVCWVLSTALNCMKDRSERVFGSTRDLLYVFLLFVACQVDGQTNYSWEVVFVVPWIWFGSLFLLAWLVLTLLSFARFWARPMDVILPLGFFSLLISNVPMFISFLFLVKLLNNPDESGLTYTQILVPNAVSWLAMWVSGLVIALGLGQKERLRDQLLASGAVWTYHEGVARRLQRDQESVRRRIDGMSEDEIAKMVDEIMDGKSKPNYLVRVGNTLYKRISDEARQMNSGGVSDLSSGGDSPPVPPPESNAHVEGALASVPLPGGAPHVALEVPVDPLGDSKVEGSASPSPRQSDRAGSPSPGARGSSGLLAEGLNILPTTSHLLRPRSAVRVLLAEESPLASSTVGPASTAAPRGSLLGGLVQDLGLAGDTAAASSSSWEAEEAAAAKARIAAAAATEAAASGGDIEGGAVGEELCIICYDQPPSCVFLECGHGGFCRRCAYLLFVRPPCECPTCRQGIEQVVELTEGMVPIGQISGVKK